MLTVIMKDPAPEILKGDPAKHRTVHITLTEEQRGLIRPLVTGESGGRVIRETITHAYLEESSNENLRRRTDDRNS